MTDAEQTPTTDNRCECGEDTIEGCASRPGLRHCPGAADTYGWLIEAAKSEAHAPLYWAGFFGYERNHWTEDHMKAVRLCRRQDAEAVAEGVLQGYAVRIAEHGWAP